MRDLTAVLGAILAGLVVLGFFMTVSDSMLDARAKLASTLVGLAGGFGAFVLTQAQLAQKRHLTFHRDNAAGPRLLEVTQNDVVVFLTATFTIKDGATGRLLGTLRKNHLQDVVRKRWEVFDARGSLACIVQEDSLVRALLRRLCPVPGVLHTDFDFDELATGAHIAEFARRSTVRDRYALRLRPGASARLDRRVALAVGVLLDTTERR
jgi:hypothetical protein